METIHLKTVDPVSQDLLRSAAQRGIELPWERYEKLQPQDGFLRLGLSCPFGCMQGPCRIDPFGRGAVKGICGLGRDEMVAGMLLRHCLQGAMEALGSAATPDGVPEMQFSTALSTMVSSVLAKNGQTDLSAEDIFKGSVMLGRSSSTCEELIVQAFRLSLLTLGFLEQGDVSASAGTKTCSAGYSTVAGYPVRIGFSGQLSTELIEALEQESTQDSNAPVALVSLGEWIALKDRFMPILCTSGESELVVSSGAIHLLVAGEETDPGLIELCRNLNVPVVMAAGVSEPASIVQRARGVYSTLSQADIFTDATPAGVAEVLMSSENIEPIVSGTKDNVALVGGADSVQMSLGQLPVELATALRDKGVQVAGWGDAALWMIKNGLMAEGEKAPLVTLENRQGPLLAVKGLIEAGEFDRLQGICFTGLKSCRDLSMALGLAYLGCRVNVGPPIPIHGSQPVMDTLAEMIQANGGQLSHSDRPAQTREIVEWFTNP